MVGIAAFALTAATKITIFKIGEILIAAAPVAAIIENKARSKKKGR
ncbi:MAG: hypothetical protein IKB72_05055 [Ruminococcus sp.]|nr:hypothetical protein [Ruminococcus sp.]